MKTLKFRTVATFDREAIPFSVDMVDFLPAEECVKCSELAATRISTITNGFVSAGGKAIDDHTGKTICLAACAILASGDMVAVYSGSSIMTLNLLYPTTETDLIRVSDTCMTGFNFNTNRHNMTNAEDLITAVLEYNAEIDDAIRAGAPVDPMHKICVVSRINWDVEPRTPSREEQICFRLSELIKKLGQMDLKNGVTPEMGQMRAEVDQLANELHSINEEAKRNV